MTKQSDFFGKPSNPRLANAVSLETPEKARKSTRKLSQMWRDAKTKDRRTEILRAANLAANRAQAQQKRGNLSPGERREFKKIERIYRDWVNEHENKTGKTMGRGPVNRMKNNISAPDVKLGFNKDLGVKKKYDKFF